MKFLYIEWTTWIDAKVKHKKESIWKLKGMIQFLFIFKIKKRATRKIWDAHEKSVFYWNDTWTTVFINIIKHPSMIIIMKSFGTSFFPKLHSPTLSNSSISDNCSVGIINYNEFISWHDCSTTCLHNQGCVVRISLSEWLRTKRFTSTVSPMFSVTCS